MANTNREKETLKSDQNSKTDSTIKSNVSNNSFSGSSNREKDSGSMGEGSRRNSGRSSYNSSAGERNDRGAVSRSSEVPDLGRERSGSSEIMDRKGRNEH